MTPRIDKLVKAGFIDRMQDEKDRRIIRIALTSEGRNFIKNSQKTVKGDMKQLLSTLTFKEIVELKKSIKTIKKILS
jgi:DNA-binding MarR family transcriptional regulator